MRKIRAYGKQNRIPMSLSNYIYDTEKGYEGAKKTFIDTINSQPFNGKKICDALNKNRNALRTFTVASETADTIILEAADHLGNKDCIRIT
ncbi:MAG: hypothetical protein EOM14_02680, partial [Clostridia bacterium]|nr:hypothetical protein [Clostridia bacterium]